MIEHTILDSSTPEWLAAMLEMESEGAVSPIQIRADFDRGGFCLHNGREPIGKVYGKYKHAALARSWVLAQLEPQS